MSKTLICYTCDAPVDTGTIYNKNTPDFHHAGCESCGWYLSDVDKIVVGYMLSFRCYLKDGARTSKDSNETAKITEEA